MELHIFCRSMFNGLLRSKNHICVNVLVNIDRGLAIRMFGGLRFVGLAFSTKIMYYCASRQNLYLEK